uniref:DZIP3-like HEPN domain-containing protein n=1 Tax=Magallana gigas TaxID=29159 RepID=A0A8W8HTT2_MAGGI
MASNVVTCQLTTPKKVNFARLSRLVFDLFARILRDILVFHYQRPEDLQQRIKDKHLEQKFKKDINRILDGDRYEKCDVTLLYTLIRFTCNIEPPTVTKRRKMEWGGECIPSRECTTLGDEIERIRIIRNGVCCHVPCTELEDNELEKYYGISLGICQRLTGQFGTKDYVKELETIRTCRMEDDSVVLLTETVKENIRMNKGLRIYVRKETKKMRGAIQRIYQKMKQQKEIDQEYGYQSYDDDDINEEVNDHYWYNNENDDFGYRTWDDDDISDAMSEQYWDDDRFIDELDYRCFADDEIHDESFYQYSDDYDIMDEGIDQILDDIDCVEINEFLDDDDIDDDFDQYLGDDGFVDDLNNQCFVYDDIQDESFYQYLDDYDVVDEEIDQFCDDIDCGDISKLCDDDDIVDDFGYCTWNNSEIDDNMIDEYWDENENHERTIDQNWDDDVENFDEFSYRSWDEVMETSDDPTDEYLPDDEIKDDVLDQYWDEVHNEYIDNFGNDMEKQDWDDDAIDQGGEHEKIAGSINSTNE